MSKKRYKTPLLMEIEVPAEDPTYNHGASQNITGEDPIYTFRGIDPDIVITIKDNLGDEDFQDMDTSGDLVIDLSEWEAWLADNEWFNDYLG